MNKKRFLVGRIGQVWVETVIYTLISFSLMGLVLAFVIPKIQENQDRGIIEQSIVVLQNIDSLIRNLGGPGNQRLLELGINKGTMTIDAQNDKIFFNLESRYQYSQPGETVNVGKITVQEEKKGNINILNLTLNYSGNYNLTYQGLKGTKAITASSVPYSISISGVGQDNSGKPIVNIEVIK